jgi:hypothetical protein
MAKKKKIKSNIPEFKTKEWNNTMNDLFYFIDNFNKTKNEKK